MRWVLMQLNNCLSGRTQSRTEKYRPEKGRLARKGTLSDPPAAKYPRNWGRNRGWVENGLTGQTEWWS